MQIKSILKDDLSTSNQRPELLIMLIMSKVIVKFVKQNGVLEVITYKLMACHLSTRNIQTFVSIMLDGTTMVEAVAIERFYYTAKY